MWGQWGLYNFYNVWIIIKSAAKFLRKLIFPEDPPGRAGGRGGVGGGAVRHICLSMIDREPHHWSDPAHQTHLQTVLVFINTDITSYVLDKDMYRVLIYILIYIRIRGLESE